MGIRIEDTDIYPGDTVDLFGHAQEVNSSGNPANRNRPSYGFFNGCPMIVIKIETKYKCTSILLRDDRSADLLGEDARYWTGHIKQVRKVK